MRSRRVEVVVAGHICVDIIPTFGNRRVSIDALLAPGKLTTVGPAAVSTGGAVSNTGVALHRLGVSTRLMGKVGTDLLGRAALDVLRNHDPSLAEGIVVAEGEASSYTIVISPPGVDRMFLHCAGANDTFGADDVDYEGLSEARLFHFGYPTIMRRIYIDCGGELATMFGRAKGLGLTTSLDMSFPDPASEAGRVDWPALLRRVLPRVDVFLPSLEEILFMLDRARFERMEQEAKPAGLISRTDGSLLEDLSGELLDMGAAIVGLKLGDQGLYLRTTGDGERLKAMGRCMPRPPSAWLDRELLAPCFRVGVVGTNGAGDCAIAGALTGLLRGLSPEAVMTGAAGVGACNVERADATSGVRSWTAVQRRIRAGWERLPVSLLLPGWRWDGEKGVWVGPNDASRKRE